MKHKINLTLNVKYTTNFLTLTLKYITVGHIVATLALGSRPRQRACKGVSQEEARESRQRHCKGAGQEDPEESHHILPRV
jgi:hypothetical protein